MTAVAVVGPQSEVPPISGGTNDPNYGISDLDAQELLELTIENLTDPDEIRSAQLRYIFKYNGQAGREFFSNINILLNTTGITVGEVLDINFTVDNYYKKLKGEYFIAIFYPVAEAAKPFIELALIETGSGVLFQAVKERVVECEMGCTVSKNWG